MTKLISLIFSAFPRYKLLNPFDFKYSISFLSIVTSYSSTLIFSICFKSIFGSSVTEITFRISECFLL